MCIDEENKQLELKHKSNNISKELGFDETLIGKDKPFTKHTTDWGKLTKWIEITILEFYEILEKEKQLHKEIQEEEICPICRCELYDEIFTMSRDTLLKKQKVMVTDPGSIEVIKFSKCADHYYHKECANMLLGDKAHLRCSIWSFLYGVNIGDMPAGKMSWKCLHPGEAPCEGYEASGTWQIIYSFYDGVTKEGVYYRGTKRIAYVPDTSDGKEVMLLLIKWFKRRLTFTVGESVTTGAKDVVVWNSVHHKTSTSGGVACYGFPDPTYFNRVKLELADKGVVMEKPDNISNLKYKGRILIKVK